MPQNGCQLLFFSYPNRYTIAVPINGAAYTNGSNENGTLTNKPYWNEGTLNGDYYTKSAARLLNRVWVNKRGLDLSKEVLWVFVGQRTAELPAIKVGGLKKILPSGRVRTQFACARKIGRILFQPLTLMAGSSVALWPTETTSTSLERSKPLLLTKSLF